MFTPKKSRAPFEVTDKVRMAALSIGLWEQHWGLKERARLAWVRLGHQLIRRGPFRPEVWWSYTVGIPDALRTPVEAPDPRWVLGDGPAPAGYYDAVRAWRQQQLRRLEWVVASDELASDEAAAARAHIANTRRVLDELPTG